MAANADFHILIGCTGSVASIKIPKLVEKFTLLGYEVKVVSTQNALHFLKAEALSGDGVSNQVGRNGKYSTCSCQSQLNLVNERELCQAKQNEILYPCLECEVKNLYPGIKFVTDKEEWNAWNKRGDPVLHIELQKWADVLILAPLDANTLAKLANGLCDNLLTCIVRAWNLAKPIYFCPAMNTQMYNHPFTGQHIKLIKDLGYQEIESISKPLMCGDIGIGAMAEVDTIVDTVHKNFLKEVKVTK